MSSLFQEQWSILCDKKATVQKRTSSYSVLTSHLKDPNISQDFYQALYDSKNDFITKILEDVRCKSCDHAALQVLGYCLYIPPLCDSFSPETIKVIVNGVCNVIQDQAISKSVCTRALWTLSNQRLPLADHVTSIVSVVTELVMSTRLTTPTVDSEALNALIRLSEQGRNVFTTSPHLWFPAIFTLSLYDLHRISSKALTFSISMATHLAENQVVISWLTKELKKNSITKMLMQLSGRGHNICHVMSVWDHVINVLGTSLHKHGSFLNDLLRVVEAGFKHRSFPVQVAAYKSWTVLISNYSLNLEVFISQKRLKLLLMPLVTSAARNKHEQVENARITTYWHLIGHLGPHKEDLFQQVCVPFLLLSLGLDPKIDTDNFMSRFHAFNTRTVAKETTSEKAPKEKENVSKETPKEKSAVSAENSELSEEMVSTRSTGSLSPDVGSKYKVGDLLKFVHSIQARSKHVNHYVGEPTVAMVMSGCHALLQFIGIKLDVSESLLTSDIDRYTVYPKFQVPMKTAEFFALFLDCLLSHTQIFTADNGALVLETVVHHLVSVLVCCIDSEQAPLQEDSNSANLIFDVLVRLVESGCLDSVICKQMRYDILRQLCSVPAQLLCACGGWRRLLGVLLGNCCKTEQLSDWFSSTYGKLLSAATTLLPASDPLRNLEYVLRQIDNCAKVGGTSGEHLSFLWLLTSRAFTDYVNETSQINLGTALEPDISLVGLILKFPFLYLIPNGSKDSVTKVIQLWKETFDICSRHASLVVKDPNYCTQLVAKELYTVYGVHIKASKSSDEIRSLQMKFDRFQYAMATAIYHIVGRLSWSTLYTADNKGQRSGCILTILSLLSWQLVTLGDSVLSLCQLASPAVVMATVSVLYQQATSEEMIVMVTASLAQPLTVCMDTALKGDRVTLTKSRQKQQNELLGYVTDTWKTILTAFQTRYASQYDTSLLTILSPLLVSALSSELSTMIDITLTFWKLTFDAHSAPLVYPPKLRDYFLTYVRSDKRIKLKLPGIAIETASSLPMASPRRHGNSSPRRGVTMSPSRHDNVLPRGDVSPSPVVHPVTSSPRKNVRGSFMNRPAHTSDHAHTSSLKPHPLSPAAKVPNTRVQFLQALDAVLTRSVSHDRRAGSRDRRGGSHDKRGGSRDKRGGTKEVSARRRLSLNRDNEQYVPVAPPPKKPRLLTVRQKERQREKYALEHSQDSLPFSETQDMDDDVIIIHASPPTNVEKCADSEIAITTVANTQVNPVNSTIINPSVTINTSLSEVPLATVSTAPISMATKLVTTTTTKPVTVATTAPTNKPVTVVTTAATKPVTVATTARTNKPVTVVTIATTKPVTVATTATTVPTTKPVSVSTTKSVTVATTAPTTKPVSVATTKSVTVATTAPTTKPVTVATTVPTTKPVSVATTKSVTVATTVPTTKPVTVATTVPTTKPVTVATTVPTTKPVSVATTKSVTVATTVPTTKPVTVATMATTKSITVTTKPVTMTTTSTNKPVTTSTAPISMATTCVNPTEKISESVGLKSLHLRPRKKQVSKPRPPVAVAMTLSARAAKMLKLAREEKSLEKVYNLHNLRGEDVSRMKATSLSPIEEMPQENSKSADKLSNSNEILNFVSNLRCVVRSDNVEAVKTNKMIAIETKSVSESNVNTQENSDTMINDTMSCDSNAHTPTHVTAPDPPTVPHISTAPHTPTHVTAPHPPTVPHISTAPHTPTHVIAPHTHTHPHTPTPLTTPHTPTVPHTSTHVTAPHTPTVPHTSTHVTAPHTPTVPHISTAPHAPTTLTEGRLTGTPTDIGARTYSRNGNGKIVELPGTGTGIVRKTKSDSSPTKKGEGDFPSVVICHDNAVTGVVDMATNSEPNITENFSSETTAVAIGDNKRQKLEASKKEMCVDNRSTVEPPPSYEADDDGVEVDNDDMTTVEDTQMEVDNNEEKLEETNTENMQVQNDELEATNDEEKTAEDTSIEAANDEKMQKEVRKNECEDLEDPLQLVKDKETSSSKEDLLATPTHQRTVEATPTHQQTVEATPTHRRSSEDGGPAGILKHISQFDTPSTAKSARRVQFGGTTVHVPVTREGKTPSHGRTARAPQAGVFSSRRTLLTLLTPPRNKMITVPKPPVTPPTSGSCDLVYPSLTECDSPIEQILPSLSASKSTHGLVQLVRARNITTVGNISSLTEQQAQTLPIKSPKVTNLRNALRSFEQNLGSKRKTSSSDSDSKILPPTKVAKTTTESDVSSALALFPCSIFLSPDPKTNFDPSMNSDPTATSKETPDVLTSKNGNVFEDSDNIIIPNTPEPTFDLSTPDSELVAMGDDKPHPPTEDLDVTPDLLPSVEDNSTSSMEVTAQHEQIHTQLKKDNTQSTSSQSILHDHIYCSQTSATNDTSNRGSHDMGRGSHDMGSGSHDMDNVSHDIDSGSHDMDSRSHDMDSVSHDMDNVSHDMGNESNIETVNSDKLCMVSSDHTYCRADVTTVISQELFSEADHISTEQCHVAPQVTVETIDDQSNQEPQSPVENSKTEQSSVIVEHEDKELIESSDSVVKSKEPIKDVTTMSESDWTLLGELLSRGANNCHYLNREKTNLLFKKSNRFSKKLFKHKP